MQQRMLPQIKLKEIAPNELPKQILKGRGWLQMKANQHPRFFPFDKLNHTKYNKRNEQGSPR